MNHASQGLITSAKKVMFLPGFVCPSVCLFVCEQDNSKLSGWILIKFRRYVQNGKRSDKILGVIQMVEEVTRFWE